MEESDPPTCVPPSRVATTAQAGAHPRRRLHNAALDANAEVGIERGACGVGTIRGADDGLFVAVWLVRHARIDLYAIHADEGREMLLQHGAHGAELHGVRGTDGDTVDVGERHGV